MDEITNKLQNYIQELERQQVLVNIALAQAEGHITPAEAQQARDGLREQWNRKGEN